MEGVDVMALIRRILAVLSGRKRAYNIELPIGLELSDGDRVTIYGRDTQINDYRVVASLFRFMNEL